MIAPMFYLSLAIGTMFFLVKKDMTAVFFLMCSSVFMLLGMDR